MNEEQLQYDIAEYAASRFLEKSAARDGGLIGGILGGAATKAIRGSGEAMSAARAGAKDIPLVRGNLLPSGQGATGITLPAALKNALGDISSSIGEQPALAGASASALLAGLGLKANKARKAKALATAMRSSSAGAGSKVKLKALLGRMSA